MRKCQQLICPEKVSKQRISSLPEHISGFDDVPLDVGTEMSDTVNCKWSLANLW